MDPLSQVLGMKRQRPEDQESRPSSQVDIDGDGLRSKRRAVVVVENDPTTSNHTAHPQVPSPSTESSEVDWRSQICSLLGLSPAEPDDELLSGATELASVLSRTGFLKTNDQPEEPAPKAAVKPYYAILHGIICGKASRLHGSGTYSSLDEDIPFSAENGHLVGKNRAKGLASFTSKCSPGLQFAIIKEYNCCSNKYWECPDGDSSEPVREQLYLVSSRICAALRSAAKSSTNSAMYPKCKELELFPSPEYWVYREMELLDRLAAADTSSEAGICLGLFMQYFHLHKDKEFTLVTALFEKRKILRKYLGYLYAPGDVIAPQAQNHVDICHCFTYKVSNWPDIQNVSPTIATDSIRARSHNTSKRTVKLKFEDALEYWDFDGVFEKKKVSYEFQESFEIDSESDILTMQMIPVRLLPNETLDRLVARGRTSWSCRKMKYVSYRGWDCDKRQEFKTARFMIDPNAFKRINPKSSFATKKLTDGLGAEAMDSESPPENDDFLFLLPPNLMGYSMEEKAWFGIWASNVEDVVWNQDSFETLVMGDKEKQLIMALVTHKIGRSVATDFFLGKGNGLVILLHGGPGTGKTLTAESVAEYAKKPLYRVTCGDIGVMPNEVEQHLKRVLNLGKTWDCVVLLDEAEVFLQERSLHDLQRNALVSVFLRILEYYDGILILTSNRVGVFDEGFKSRIQLAIHYDNLSPATRKKIWKNFIDRLETFDEDIDIADLRANLARLSKHVLNGREIRNAVTTARQLARFKKTLLDFECLEDVINVSIRFTTYLKDRVNEGLNDDDLAKEKGVRG